MKFDYIVFCFSSNKTDNGKEKENERERYREKS